VLDPISPSNTALPFREDMAKAPSRIVPVFAALFTQLIGAACLVIGLASIPMVHDTHRGNEILIGWIAGAFFALICGGLSYQGRIIPLLLSAIVDAAFGFIMPRGDSAVGTLKNLLPKGDVPEDIVMYTAIGMFVVGALCLAALPWALRYRTWLTEDPDGSRYSMQMQAQTAAAKTMMGMSPARTTMVVHLQQAKGKPWVIVTVAATLVGVGVALILGFGLGLGKKGKHVGDVKPEITTKKSDDKKPDDTGAKKPDDTGSKKPDDSTAKKPDDVPAKKPGVNGKGAASPQALAQGLDDAIEAGTGDIGQLLEGDAFGVGIDATELAADHDAILALAAKELVAEKGSSFDVAFTQVGTDGSLAWIAQEVKLGSRRLAISAVAHEDGGAWRIAAICIARPLDDGDAMRLAKAKQLPALAALPDRHAGADDLLAAARKGFSERKAFAAARSTRADAFNFGSAAERQPNGSNIKKLFERFKAAELTSTGSIVAGSLGARAGWTLANVDFTVGGVTQSMRVLAAWVKEADGWRMVQTQWSNGGPYPR
jgi:hypothetical protein